MTALVALFAWSTLAAAERVPVDRVVAVVGVGSLEAHVLESDVELRALMRRLWIRDARGLHAPLTAEERQGALEELLGELLVEREAARVGVTAPGAADVERERTRLRTSLGGDDAFGALTRRFRLAPAEVQTMVTRRALVAAFLRANLEGATEVSDAEVQRVYGSAEHPFGSAPLEQVRDVLRAWLQQRAIDRAVARWVNVLETRLRVQVFAPYVRRAAESPGPATPR